jgi:hypothetical protein
MDQRSDHIRQDIESTRAALDEKLDSLETKARQAFDLNHQVAERPWMTLGAAVAAGFVLGSLTGGNESEQRWHGQPATTTDYNHHEAGSAPLAPSASGSAIGDTLRSTADSFMSQFDDEIDMLKSAAIATLTTFLRDAVKEYVPAISQQLDQTLRNRGMSTSSAPGASTSELSGASKYYDVRESPTSVNYESIPQTTSQQSNLADRTAEHATPYYPPGSSAERERSVGGDTTRY